MPINTLEASKRLKELGFNEDQSEGLAQLLSELDVAGATKEDLNDLEKNLTGQIGDLESRIDNLESRIEKLDEKVATRTELETAKNAMQSDVEAAKSELGERIERMEKRILVIGAPAVAALMALLNYLMA